MTTCRIHLLWPQFFRTTYVYKSCIFLSNHHWTKYLAFNSRSTLSCAFFPPFRDGHFMYPTSFEHHEDNDKNTMYQQTRVSIAESQYDLSRSRDKKSWDKSNVSILAYCIHASPYGLEIVEKMCEIVVSIKDKSQTSLSDLDEWNRFQVDLLWIGGRFIRDLCLHVHTTLLSCSST